MGPRTPDGVDPEFAALFHQVDDDADSSGAISEEGLIGVDEYDADAKALAEWEALDPSKQAARRVRNAIFLSDERY